MGLDLVVEGRAKLGHEAEWRRLLERSFAGDQLSESETARFHDISVPEYASIGAPQVGSSAAADAWIVRVQNAQSPEEVAATLRQFKGYYVVALVQCDGVPKYSNGRLSQGVDETSFRGQFLEFCGNVIDKQLLNAAWEHKFPDAAIAYGQALLAAADIAEKKPRDTLRSTFLSRLGLMKSPEPTPLSEQRDIVRAAGRWFVFWGERGHAIRAYF